MNELLQAAKAVIESWDRIWIVGTDVKIKKLRAAVERAENPPAGFEEWWSFQGFYPVSKKYAKELWQAAQQAERERIRDIINSVLDVNGRDDDWYVACNLIMERIDAT